MGMRNRRALETDEFVKSTYSKNRQIRGFDKFEKSFYSGNRLLLKCRKFDKSEIIVQNDKISSCSHLDVKNINTIIL